MSGVVGAVGLLVLIAAAIAGGYWMRAPVPAWRGLLARWRAYRARRRRERAEYKAWLDITRYPL